MQTKTIPSPMTHAIIFEMKGHWKWNFKAYLASLKGRSFLKLLLHVY